MTTINILRTDLDLPDMTAAGRFLFGAIDGFTRDDKRAWRSFWRRIRALEPGEMAVVEARLPRSSPYHRRHMATANFRTLARSTGQKMRVDRVKK